MPPASATEVSGSRVPVQAAIASTNTISAVRACGDSASALAIARHNAPATSATKVPRTACAFSAGHGDAPTGRGSVREAGIRWDMAWVPCDGGCRLPLMTVR